MENFDIHILGCGSSLPTMRHFPSCQVVSLRDRLYMVDCGEGAQLQLRRSHLKFTRLSHIFISHLHGDHIFGLMGLVSTFGMLGRETPLHVHAPEQLERLLCPQLDFLCHGLPFELVFDPVDFSAAPALIYEDRAVSVHTIPLRHRVPCTGFIFREKAALPHIRRDMIDFLHIPHYAIQGIKEGAGWTTPEGDVYPHACLVRLAEPARAYAYCSDTAYAAENAPLLRGVDLLYHEATFADQHAARAIETMHSTARQAALMAREAGAKRLVIGHFSSRYDDDTPLLDEARAVFPGTELAREGAVFHI